MPRREDTTSTLVLNGHWQLLFKVVMILLPIVLSVQIGIDGWMVKMIFTMKEWQAKTDGNRFTSKDGLEIWKEIADCRQMLAGQKAWIDVQKDKHRGG